MGKKVTKVFYISLLIALLFIVWGIVPSSILPTWNLNNITTNIQGFIVDKFGWFYLLSATSFLIFAIFLVVSKYGNIKLGKEADKPEYNYLTWFGMLFSAGMGIGLVFWELRNLSRISTCLLMQPRMKRKQRKLHYGIHFSTGDYILGGFMQF